MTAAPSFAEVPDCPPEPDKNCALCPRLLAYRERNQERHPDFYNGAVPSFGDEEARLLVVGMAPGLKGANRTARPFTGDVAGDLLYPTLKRFGFGRGHYGADPKDGFTLHDALITNAVRCVPPENKPTTKEVTTCRRFLVSRIRALEKLEVIFALGRIAHDAVLTALDKTKAHYRFGHGAVHNIDGLFLVDSYHCSRYNVNTGRLTPEMFEGALRTAQRALD